MMAQAFEQLSSRFSSQQRANGSSRRATARSRAEEVVARARAAAEAKDRQRVNRRPSPEQRATRRSEAVEEDLFWTTWTYEGPSAASSASTSSAPFASSSSSAPFAEARAMGKKARAREAARAEAAARHTYRPSDSPTDLFKKKHGAPVAARRAAQAAAWAARAAASPEVEIGAESHWTTAAPRAEGGADAPAAASSGVAGAEAQGAQSQTAAFEAEAAR